MLRPLLLGLLLTLALAACGNDEPAAAPTPSTSAGASRAPVPMAVVGHASRPALRLDRATFERLVDGDTTRVQGRSVVTRATSDAAIRAVQRDPDAVAVVPLDDVTPTVRVARVGGVDPVRSASDATTLTVVGDVMLTRRVPDPVAALAPMRQRLRSADVTVGNLESTLSTRGTPTQGGDSFGGSPALIGPLADAGFDAISLANNHAGDYGTGALRDTVAELADSPIRSFGAGSDLAAASRPAIVERNGVRFGFVGFNAIGETPRATPGSTGALSVRMPPRTGPLVAADLDHVADVVRRTARQVDVVVVLPHWGTQYTHAPEPIQRQVSRRLVAAGADLVVGGHPHWTQGVDAVDGVPVVNSLGNFVFDMDFSTQTMEGVVLEATFRGTELAEVRFVPYRMDDGSFAPRVVPGGSILADLWSTSTGPFAP